jgi:hypothetical protein
MNISGGNLPAMSSSGQGGEVYTAALSKKQQLADGAAALALIEGAANQQVRNHRLSRSLQHWVTM